jgi:hypothetical protein
LIPVGSNLECRNEHTGSRHKRIQKAWNRVLKEAGPYGKPVVDKLRLHDLRHTCDTNLARSEKDIQPFNRNAVTKMVHHQHRGFDMENEENKTKSELYWESRKLCSDLACIGVIRSDGRCKECGKPYEGEAFEDSPFAEPEPESEPETDEIVDDQVEEYEETEAVDDGESGTDEDWANRKLCSDPACIGVIGADGQCKECGKPYSGK